MWTGAWPSLGISRLERSIDGVAALVAVPAHGQPDEVTRVLSRFLVLRSCGFLEQVVEECCRAHIASKSAPQVAAFASSWLGRGNNPTPERLVELVRRFDRGWADELLALFDEDDQRLRREISLLVDRQNKIAHGLGEGLGARKALDLLKDTKTVADWFILRLDPR